MLWESLGKAITSERSGLLQLSPDTIDVLPVTCFAGFALWGAGNIPAILLSQIAMAFSRCFSNRRLRAVPWKMTFGCCGKVTSRYRAEFPAFKRASLVIG